MTNKYISKQEAIDIVVFECGKWTGLAKEISKQLKQLPAADVAPVVHAKWEHVKHKSIEHGEVVIDGDTVRCSACRHAKKGWDAGMNFCPECGAKMDGEREE